MTEYDFSPEAYQAHLENMSRISRWVDRTEEHRTEFGDAAALVEDQRIVRDSSPSHSYQHRKSFGRRRRNIPPPLPLHPYGTPDPMYTPMATRQFGMSPYVSAIHSADNPNLGFLHNAQQRRSPNDDDGATSHVSGSGISTTKPAPSSP
ncbi:hypothetical protein C0995_005542 [Termitomyces sp. Mi166|nr:hypothetical protein C0995_005542 [Termitomyces sp. Mi166\